MLNRMNSLPQWDSRTLIKNKLGSSNFDKFLEES